MGDEKVSRDPCLHSSRNGTISWWMPVFVLAALAIVVGLGFDRGWLPHDDGYLAMSAERVLDGEHPHADFDEIYTGGLTYLNAWALDTFGMDLVSLRIPYLAFLAGFVLSTYAICRRFFDRLQSSVVASSTVFLGPYMTSSPMPSSYNVFLAGIVLFCALRYFETEGRLWIVIAGTVSGLGILVKTTGLYLVLGVGIGLIAFHAQRRASGPDPVGRFLLVGAALLVTAFISADFTISRLVGLVLPVWLVVVLVLQLRSSPGTEAFERDKSLRSLIPYAMGVFIPLFAYGLFLAGLGTLGETVAGLVAIPRLFVGELARDLSPLITVAVPLVITLVIWRMRPPLESVSNLILSLSLTAVGIVWYLADPRSEISVLFVTFSWIPMLLPAFAVVMGRRRRTVGSHEPIVLATVAVAVCMQLVRFPHSSQWYVFYSLPLTVVGFMILMGRREWPRRSLAVAAVVAVAGLVGLAGYEGRIFTSGALGAQVPFIELQGDRGGIEVPVFYDYYNDLGAQLALGDETILAGPDTPELYFLLDIPPPGRSAIQLISAARGEADTMLSAWDRLQPGTVIVNTSPANSELEPEFVSVVATACDGPQVFGLLSLYTACRPAP